MATAPPRAWVLNLAAELELEIGRGYTPRRAVIEQVRANRPKARALLGAEDVLLDEEEVLSGAMRLPPELRGVEGRAFCPTPRALRVLRIVGARPAAAPSFDVLRQVNDRRFNAEIGQTLEAARFALTAAEAHAIVERRSPTGAWILKRSYGFAGKGRRRIERVHPDDVRWIDASFQTGGVQIEPFVEVAQELAQHGEILQDGTIRLFPPCMQHCPLGVWQQSEPANGTLPHVECQLIENEANITAHALAAAGYFGPFNIDAIRYRDLGGNVRLYPRTEINARYTMGWPLAALQREGL